MPQMTKNQNAALMSQGIFIDEIGVALHNPTQVPHELYHKLHTQKAQV
jgi:hypothetical protein